MTIITNKTQTCTVCGHSQDFSVLLSFSTFGISCEDLDGRDADLDRWLLDMGVQCCGQCGACWSSLQNVPPEATALIQTPRYQAQLEDIVYPRLANQYRCKALIELKLGKQKKAADSYKRAAWACDDEDNCSFPAMLCRMEAIRILQEAAAPLSLDTQLTLIDLMRRTIYQTEAAQLVSELLLTIEDDWSKQILEFQLALLEKDDDGRYTVQEALGEPRPTWF